MNKNKTLYLKHYYETKVVEALMKDFHFKNIMQTPKLIKIVLNMGLGDAVVDSKCIDTAMVNMTLVAGQKAIITKARKSIAAFKLRKNMPIGIMVTLRRERMWEFLYRLLNIALPRVRDFRGVESRFDGRGNCSIGVKEQIIFPEVGYSSMDKSRGMNITLVTNTSKDNEAKVFFQLLGLPFKHLWDKL